MQQVGRMPWESEIEKLLPTEPPTPMEDEILTVKDVANLLRISRMAVYMKVRRKQIPYNKVGGTLYFSKVELINHYLPKRNTECS